MIIKPLLSRVLVRLVEDRKETVSGLVIPENSENKIWAKGIVEEKGPGEPKHGYFIANDGFEIGDEVMFIKPWDGQKIMDGMKTLYIINREDVLAKTSDK